MKFRPLFVKRTESLYRSETSFRVVGQEELISDIEKNEAPSDVVIFQSNLCHSGHLFAGVELFG